MSLKCIISLILHLVLGWPQFENLLYNLHFYFLHQFLIVNHTLIHSISSTDLRIVYCLFLIYIKSHFSFCRNFILFDSYLVKNRMFQEFTGSGPKVGIEFKEWLENVYKVFSGFLEFALDVFVFLYF